MENHDRRSRPGPRPRRLFVRIVRRPNSERAGASDRAAIRHWLDELERVGRLVAAGPTTEPIGHLVIVRADDLAEARRILRADPFSREPDEGAEIWEWDASRSGVGVNLQPAPARGAGRLTALNRISVFVADQAKALAWYREVLGLAVRSEDPETEFVELSLGPGAAGVTLVRPRPSWGEPSYSEARARIGQRTGIAFQTDSVDALGLRLRHAGARVSSPVTYEPWGGRSLRFTDPDGNEFLAFDEGPPKAAPRPPAPGRRLHRRKPDPA